MGYSRCRSYSEFYPFLRATYWLQVLLTRSKRQQVLSFLGGYEWRRQQEAPRRRTIDGNDVYCQQETVVVAAVAAAVEDELEGPRPPTRDYGNERQRREMAETANWQQ